VSGQNRSTQRLASVSLLISVLWLSNGIKISQAQSPRQPAAKYLKLQTPVKGNCYVLAGPPCPSKSNHHCKINSQKFAYDFIKLDQRGQPTSCLGTTVNSPTNGTIVTVVDQNPNRAKGKRPTGHPAGNHIVIHRRGTEFVILGHLSPHTIQVAVGQKVEMGDPVAECGSSGQATASHVHVHMQTTKEPLDFSATALPMVFTRTGTVTKKGCKSKAFYILKTGDIHCSPTRFQ
jgi:hypothetical protein